MLNTSYSGKFASAMLTEIEIAANSVLGENQRLPVKMVGNQFMCRAWWTANILLDVFLKYADRDPALNNYLWNAMAQEVNSTPKPEPGIWVARPKGPLPRWIQVALYGGAYHEGFHYWATRRTAIRAEEIKDLLEDRWRKIKNWGRYRNFLSQFHNIAEDIRIERRGIEKNPGAEIPLYDLQDFILDMEAPGREQNSEGRALDVIPWAYRDIGLGYSTVKSRANLEWYQNVNPGALKVVTDGPLTPILKRNIALKYSEKLGALACALDACIAIQNYLDDEINHQPPPPPQPPQGPGGDPPPPGQPGDPQDQDQDQPGQPGGPPQDNDPDNDQDDQNNSGQGQGSDQDKKDQEKGQDGESDGQDEQSGDENQDGSGSGSDQDQNPQDEEGNGGGSDQQGEDSEGEDQDQGGSGSQEDSDEGDSDGQGSDSDGQDGDSEDSEGSQDGKDGQDDSPPGDTPAPGEPGEPGDDPSDSESQDGKDGQDGDQKGDSQQNGDSDSDGQSSDGNDSESDSDQDGGQDGSANEIPEQTGHVSGQAGDVNASAPDGQELIEALESLVESLDNEEESAVLSLQEAMAEALKGDDEQKDEDNRPWNPFCADGDQIEPPTTHDGSEAAADVLLDSVKTETAYLRSRLSTLLRALEIRNVRHGVKRGRKLSGRRLVHSRNQLVNGIVPNRAFQKKTEKIDTSVAAGIVFDESSSMKWHLQDATRGMLALVEPLDYIKAATMAIGFRSGRGASPEYCELSQSERNEADASGDFHRTRNVCIDVFKRFEEEFIRVKGRFAHTQASGSTPMSDGIQYALEALSERTEGHRIMFVITDGCPSDRAVVNHQLLVAKEAGIHVIGVGITSGASYVTNLFEDHVYCENVAELPIKMIDKLNSILVPNPTERGKKIQKAV